MRRRAVVAGIAASALHGAQWVDDAVLIELICSNTRPPSGLIARDETLGDDEIEKLLRRGEGWLAGDCHPAYIESIQ